VKSTGWFCSNNKAKDCLLLCAIRQFILIEKKSKASTAKDKPGSLIRILPVAIWIQYALLTMIKHPIMEVKYV
jgi:hypothetical protein